MSNANTLSGRVLLVGATDVIGRPAALTASQPWSCSIVSTSREALRHLRDHPDTDLVVLVPGPDLHTARELARQIKLNPRLSFLAVVAMLAAAQSAEAAELYDAGVDDCILATAPPRETVLRLHKALRLKRATDSLEDAAAMVTALAAAVEGKDHYTCGHVERVGAYCVQIGRRLNLDDAALAALQLGGVVHDIGKIGVPDQVLNKPGKLTDEEMATMQRHPLIGHDILRPLRTFRDVLPIVRWHHERPNGTGYPDRLQGEELPLLPRIAAVADVFDALATDRPYRPAFPLPKCREILGQMAERDELDRTVVATLFATLTTSRLPEGAPLPAA